MVNHRNREYFHTCMLEEKKVEIAFKNAEKVLFYIF
jgi:hypothetical protein